MKKHAKPFRSTFTKMLPVAALATLGVGPAFAQVQQTEGTAATLPKGWVKVCDVDENSKKNVCAISIQVKNDQGQDLASIRIVEVEDAPNKGFSIIVPPGLLLQPGLRVQVDSSKQRAVPFQICLPQACIAESRVNKDFVDGLKRGNELKVTALNQAGQPFEFKATLAGFTATYDGPGIDPQQALAATETLQQKLQRRAEEARKKLLEEQQSEN